MNTFASDLARCKNTEWHAMATFEKSRDNVQTHLGTGRCCIKVNHFHYVQGILAISNKNTCKQHFRSDQEFTTVIQFQLMSVRVGLRRGKSVHARKLIAANISIIYTGMHILALCWFAVTGEGPCDILGNAGNPCVAAHSTVRALYGAYEGSLYKVTRGSDGESADIGVLSPGGFANITAHDTFCPKLDCVISNVFDQTPNGNHLGQFFETTRRRCYVQRQPVALYFC